MTGTISKRERKRWDKQFSEWSQDRAYKFKFVHDHSVACFVCKRRFDGKEVREIAKIGWNQYGPWAICVPCVQQTSVPQADTAD